jgi:hypothetical protein
MPSSISNSEIQPAATETAASKKPAHRSKLRAFLIQLAILVAIVAVLDQCLGWVLIRGLDKYFGLDRTVDILCVGHSHTVLGINADQLERETGLSVAKYATNGVDTMDRLAMIRHDLERHTQAPRAIVYDVDPWTFTVEGLSSNSYRLFYPYIDDPVMGQYVRRCEPSSSEFFWRRICKTLRYDDNAVWCSLRGYLGYRSNLKRGTVDIAKLQRDIQGGRSRQIKFSADNIRCFGETIRVVRSRGCKLILLYIPTVDVLNQSGGGDFDKALAMFKKYASDNEGVYFLNYNSEFQGRHELFFDPIHLNPKGQQVITQRLGRDLQRILTDANHGTEASAAR